mmetsp:Transcript_30049/g.89131  ORF Transcript_30049/g.89131 Transcript_30049/m.89131 type:complete len:357 (-) Transcript_30049:896-1966(-)
MKPDPDEKCYHTCCANSWLWNPPEIHHKLYIEEPSYTFAQWDDYRNINYRYRPTPWLTLRVMLGVWQPLIILAVVSVLVCSYFQWLVPLGAPGQGWTTSSALFTVASFLLSLLLTFKINQTYGRWWEARTIWGTNLGIARNFMRLMFAWSDASTRHVAHDAARWTPAFMWLTLDHVRNGSKEQWKAHVQGMLTPSEITYLESLTHLPLATGHMMSHLVRCLKVDSFKQVALEQLLSDLLGGVAGMERILRTPLPPGYSRFMTRALLIYVYTMPVLLWPVVGWASPVISAIVAFIFFGVENVAVQIEEPHRSLDLRGLCVAVQASAEQLRAAASDPDALAAVQHFGAAPPTVVVSNA